MNRVVRPIWTGDATVLARTLATQPEYLEASTQLRVGNVLRHLSLPFIGNIDFYGSILTSLAAIAGRRGFNLVEFPYDWRLSCAGSATRLLARLADLHTTQAVPVTLVTHSMGGIVARLALSHPQYSQQVHGVERLIHIATPIVGSPTAFRTLKWGPRVDNHEKTLVGYVAEAILEAIKHINPDLYFKLFDIIRRFPSVYELLPHENDYFIHFPSGEKSSAVADRHWPHLPCPNLDLVNVRAVQSKVRECRPPSAFAIYTDSVAETDSDYFLDHPGSRILNTSHCLGDGVVSVFSASYGIEECACKLVRAPVVHSKLPGSKETQAFIWEVLT